MEKLLSSLTAEVLIGIAGFLLGLGTTLNAVIAWYGNSIKKKYAAERDFNHLKGNYQQLAENVAVLDKDLDSAKDLIIKELVEIKGMIYSLISKKNQEH